MLENNFVELGTFERLKPGKRVVRLIIGVALIAYFVWQLPGHGVLTTTEFPLAAGKWIGVGILFYYFSDVFNIGFNRRWGRGPQYGFLILLGAALVADWFLFGAVWGPPAGWLVYLMQEFTAGTIGLAHIISAVLAAPG